MASQSEKMRNSHARVLLPQGMRTHVSCGLGTALWLDGREIIGVKSLMIGPITPGNATTITVELIVGGLEIKYDNAEGSAE